MIMKECKNCGKMFTAGVGRNGTEDARNSRSVYCSRKCGADFQTKRVKELNPHIGKQSTASTGAISEMIICADLLRRGFSVFRSVSPACECDILILLNGKFARVEVKTAYLLPSGKAMYTLTKGQDEKHDILALVFHADNRVEYRPTPEEFYKVSEIEEEPQLPMPTSPLIERFKQMGMAQNSA